MNSNIEKLYSIAKKPKRLIIGLMSGTSLDGLDVALCSIEGNGYNTKLELLHFETAAYTNEFKEEIKTIFSKQNVSLEKLCLLNPWVALQHAKFINSLLKKWNIDNSDIDIIASHGQTIYHSPKSLHRQQQFGNATLQIGDGDHLAVATGIITISDFRQKHIAAGGEGAPLAVYGDALLFTKKGEDRILLNIGGIANFTFLPGNETGKIICTDVGPGNTMMDAYVQQNFPGKYFDEDAAIAKKGVVNKVLLNALKDNAFFEAAFPKTTGPELFNIAYLENAKKQSATAALNIEDTMATLNKFTADTIAAAIKKCIPDNNAAVFVSGGGAHNPLLMASLKELLPGKTFFSTAALGIDPDAKEAILFAILANECICGSDFKNEGIIPVSMGKISFPL